MSSEVVTSVVNICASRGILRCEYVYVYYATGMGSGAVADLLVMLSLELCSVWDVVLVQEGLGADEHQLKELESGHLWLVVARGDGSRSAAIFLHSRWTLLPNLNLFSVLEVQLTWAYRSKAIRFD